MTKRWARAAVLAACGALCFAAGFSQWVYQNRADAAHRSYLKMQSGEAAYTFSPEEWQKVRLFPFADRYRADFNAAMAYLIRGDREKAAASFYLAAKETKDKSRQAEAAYNSGWLALGLYLRNAEDVDRSQLNSEAKQALKDYFLSLYINPILQAFRQALRLSPGHADAAFNYELLARELEAASRRAAANQQKQSYPQLQPGKHQEPPRP